MKIPLLHYDSFAALLNDDKLTEHTEQVIAREEKRVRDALKPYAKVLSGKKALLYTGGVKSWSVISALSELGIETVATGTTKSTQADKNRIIDIMGEDALMLDEGEQGICLIFITSIMLTFWLLVGGICIRR